MCRVASDRSKASRNTPLAAPLAGGRRGRERASDGSLSRLLCMRDRWWAGGLPRVSLAPMLCWAESRVRCLIAGPRVPACRCRAALHHTRTRLHAKFDFAIPARKKKTASTPASGLDAPRPVQFLCPPCLIVPQLHVASLSRVYKATPKVGGQGQNGRGTCGERRLVSRNLGAAPEGLEVA